MRQSLFVGKVVGTPTLRETFSGSPVLNLEIIVRERQGDGFVENTFRVAVFGDQARRMARQAKEGSEIMAVCRPENREYVDKHGRKRRSEDHIAMVIRVCVPDEEGA